MKQIICKRSILFVSLCLSGLPQFASALDQLTATAEEGVPGLVKHFASGFDEVQFDYTTYPKSGAAPGSVFQENHLSFRLSDGFYRHEVITYKEADNGEPVPSHYIIEIWDGSKYINWTRRVSSVDEVRKQAFSDLGAVLIASGPTIKVPSVMKPWHDIIQRPISSLLNEFSITQSEDENFIVSDGNTRLFADTSKKSLSRVEYIYCETETCLNRYVGSIFDLDRYRTINGMHFPTEINQSSISSNKDVSYEAVHLISEDSIKFDFNFEERLILEAPRGAKIVDRINGKTEIFHGGILGNSTEENSVINMLNELLEDAKRSN